MERRRFFRIEDKVELAFRVLQENETGESQILVARGRSQAFSELENQIQIAYEKVRRKEPEVAELFNLLNRKVSLLMQEDNSTLQLAEQPFEQPVNLSACGIAFLVSELVPVGSRLLLRMRLKPSHNEITLVAIAISCEALPEDETPSCLLRADFTNINDEQQELLIQHVMKCQTQQLRERRQSKS